MGGVGWSSTILLLTKRIMKPVSANWVSHAARVGEMRLAYRNRSENLKGRDHLEDVDVNCLA